MNKTEALSMKLWYRLLWAKENLENIKPKYRIIYEDPDTPDEPAKVVVPSGAWMACALQGNILPPVNAYHELRFQAPGSPVFDNEKDAKTWCDEHGENYKIINGEVLHNRVIGPMTEEQAMEYLLEKDVPKHVWSNKYNRPMFAIVSGEQIPKDRTYRNSWSIEGIVNNA